MGANLKMIAKDYIPVDKKQMTMLSYQRRCRKICKQCTLCPVHRKPCNAGRLDKGFFCREDIWPKPPDELKKAYDILMAER